MISPKLAIAAALFIAIACAAYFLTAAIVPTPRSTALARYSAARAAQALKSTHKGTVKSPAPTHPAASASPAPKSASQSPSAPSSAPTAAGPVMTPATSVPVGNVECDYGDDTWSGDASIVGYSVTDISSSDGDLASFAVGLNADPGTTEVVGYPDDQCLIYAALPSSLTSSFDITPPADSSGLDYEYAYDIWLTTASDAINANWNNDLELMIWTYVNGQVPAGSVAATLSDGAQVWVAGNNTTGTVSVVLPQNETIGTVDIDSIISQLTALGYVSSSDNGILDVGYGIEAPYGGGRTFEVNGFSVTTG